MLGATVVRDKILAISYFLPPSLTPQAMQIGRLLYSSQLKIIAVSGRDEKEITDVDLYKDFNEHVFQQIVVENKMLLPGILHKIATKFLSFYGEKPDCYKFWINYCLRRIETVVNFNEIKAIVTFGQPMSDHLIGLILKEKYNIPWIAHFSDPWAENPFRKKTEKLYMYNRSLEEKVLQNADKVIFTSEETLKLVIEKNPYLNKEKMFILPHSYDESLYPENRDTNKKILFRYIGNLYGNRSPKPLFDALCLIKKKKPEVLNNITVEIIGSISKRMFLCESYKELPCELLKMLPSVTYKKSLELMKNADVLLVIDAPAEKSVFLPSKLIDYIGTKNFIAGITPTGTSSRVLKDLNCPSEDPLNTERIAEMICDIVEKRMDKTFVMKKEVYNKYNKVSVAQEFDKIINL